MDVTGPSGEETRVISNGYWGTVSFARDTSDEVVDRVLSIFDYMLSENGEMLITYGVEGTDYEILEDDSIGMLWEQDENGVYVCPYEVNSDRILALSGLCENRKAIAAYADPVVVELTNQITDLHVNYDSYIENDIDVPKMLFTSDTYDSFVPDVQSKFIELIMTSDDIEADWTAWVSTYQEQADIICAEMTEALID